jgi:hypothetical protein
VGELKLKFISNRVTDGRQHNLPSCSEVAALLVEQNSGDVCHQDIVIEHKIKGLKRIIEFAPKFHGTPMPIVISIWRRWL